MCLWFFSSCCVTLPSVSPRTFVLFYCILFCLVWLLSLGSLFFSEGRQRGVDVGEGRLGLLGGVEEGETVVGMYRRREETIFNKNKLIT